MGLFDTFKTRIFPGINDLPVEASQEQASNGSSLIDKINGLCDTLNTLDVSKNVEITEMWEQFSTFYLNTVNGNDNNSGFYNEQAKKTVTSLIDLIRTKQMLYPITIYVEGEINETLDFSKLKQVIRTIDSDFDIYIYTELQKQCIIKHSHEIIKHSFDSPVSVNFRDCKFVSLQDGLKLNNLRKKIKFSGCTFEGAFNAYSSVLNIQDCSLIQIENYTPGSFIKGDSNCFYGLICCHNSNLYLDGGSFDGFYMPISLFGFSTIINEGNFIAFNNYSKVAEIYRGATLLSSHPESFLNHINTYGTGKFNNFISERFVLNQTSDTTITLFTNQTSFKKALAFSVNSLPINTTAKLYIDEISTELILSESILIAKSNSIELPIVEVGQALKIEIVGTIPNNTIFTIELIEISFFLGNNEF